MPELALILSSSSLLKLTPFLPLLSRVVLETTPSSSRESAGSFQSGLIQGGAGNDTITIDALQELVLPAWLVPPSKVVRVLTPSL